MLEKYFMIIVIGGIIVLVGSGLWFSHRAAKKRREGFIAIAESMGLACSPEGDSELLQKFSNFNLFSQGRSRSMKNVIQGDSGEVNIAIFDYEYTIGSGKNQRSHRQSVVSLHSPQIQCPDFTMRPEGMLDKIGSALGFQDIDFDTHPKFSKMFVLKSSNETATRAFFTAKVLEFFETKQGISVEAATGSLFFYRPSRQIKPEEVKDYLAQAYEVFGTIVDARA